MTRPVVAALAFLCLAPAARASLAPRDDAPFDRVPPAVRLKPAAPTPTARATPAPAAELTITEETEVRLNGRPCAYRDVPANAAVSRAEVSSDGKTIIRIEFRTPR